MAVRFIQVHFPLLPNMVAGIPVYPAKIQVNVVVQAKAVHGRVADAWK